MRLGKVLHWCKIQKWWTEAGNKTTIVFSCYGNYSSSVEMYVVEKNRIYQTNNGYTLISWNLASNREIYFTANKFISNLTYINIHSRIAVAIVTKYICSHSYFMWYFWKFLKNYGFKILSTGENSARVLLQHFSNKIQTIVVALLFLK